MALFLWGVFVVMLACSRRTFEVCLSPGCVAGAQAALDRMQALAPPGCIVEPGVCASACGAGPVVLEPGDKSQRIVHKRVKGDALLELLVGEDGEGIVPDGLARGYDLVQEAQAALSVRKFNDAVVLFEKGIGMAVELAKDQSSVASDGSSKLYVGLEWLVRSYCGEARARLGSFDKDGALRATNAAVELSCRSDPLCFELLAEVYAAKKDTNNELEALRSMFALPEDPDTPRDILNRRRTWGFRLARLEREASK
eukprot:CAMPEP_0113525522 /NCGR_PEP_ID=MMETSP0015_2-20120614/211_1 /TAXON_ID=2838 /ORGANISM="Odontella" /LENGTH=254 /DNA_ID=CAMNT_0000423703 /DNA_START=278 /DNA_END=1042 /DNA_ORIENTATION=- /assembly_acc=CAM_ASM_000160